MNIPITGSESHETRTPTMGAGLHLVKIKSIEPGADRYGKPYTDKRGYPSVRITFRNKKGEEISKLYYYSDKPANDPSRADKNQKCTREWILGKLKNALGIGTKEVPFEQIRDIAIWVAIIMKRYKTKDGEVLTKSGEPISSSEVGVDYWPGSTPYEEIISRIDGVDCQVHKDAQPTGLFLEYTKVNDISKFDCDQNTEGHSRVEQSNNNDDAGKIVDNTSSEETSSEETSDQW